MNSQVSSGAELYSIETHFKNFFITGTNCPYILWSLDPNHLSVDIVGGDI